MTTASASASTVCAGCGFYHGSVNLEFICLRQALAKAREEIARFKRLYGSGDMLRK